MRLVTDNTSLIGDKQRVINGGKLSHGTDATVL